MISRSAKVGPSTNLQGTWRERARTTILQIKTMETLSRFLHRQGETCVPVLECVFVCLWRLMGVKGIDGPGIRRPSDSGADGAVCSDRQGSRAQGGGG